MKRITLFIVIIALLAVVPLQAQDVSRVGTGAAQFLKVGMGARAAALGNTAVACEGDISGLYWNPAGIASMDRVTVGLTQNKLYADISYNFVAAVVPLGHGSALGVSALYMDSGDIEITTLTSPDGTGSYFQWEAFAIGLTYSRYVTNALSLGGTVKYVQEGAYFMKAKTIAFDLGSLLDTGLLGLKLGMGLGNFGSDMSLSGSSLRVIHKRWENNPGALTTEAYLKTEKYPLPLVIRMGLSTDLVGTNGQLLKSESNRITVSADAYDSNDALMQSNYGIEYEWNNILALRGGFRGVSVEKDEFDSYDTASFSVGAGIKYDLSFMHVQFDYAYSDYQILGGTQQISVILAF